MKKLAGLLRAGGRAYLADFYAKGALSAQDQTLLHDEVACSGLLTKNEYTSALQDAGFATVRFEDVTSEYAAFVHQRWTAYRDQNTSAQCDALTRFYKAMDALSGAAMAHRPGWGDAECISNGDALICKTVSPPRLLLERLGYYHPASRQGRISVSGRLVPPPQGLVGQCHLGRGQLGAGGQHELVIQPGLAGDRR